MPLDTTYAVLLKKKLTKYRAQWRESNWMISIVSQAVSISPEHRRGIVNLLYPILQLVPSTNAASVEETACGDH